MNVKSGGHPPSVLHDGKFTVAIFIVVPVVTLGIARCVKTDLKFLYYVDYTFFPESHDLTFEVNTALFEHMLSVRTLKSRCFI